VKANTAADTGRRVPPSRRTIAEFFAEWLTAVRHSLKPSTYANYADVVRIIGKRRLQDIDVPTLDELYRHLLREGRCKPDTNVARYDYWRTRRLAAIELPPREIARQSGTSIHAARAAVQRYRRGRVPTATTPGLAPKTVKNVHRMLHRALSDAVAWGYLAANPATHASLPRERRRSARQRGKTWTADAWLKVATQDRDAAMWVARRPAADAPSRSIHSPHRTCVAIWRCSPTSDGSSVRCTATTASCSVTQTAARSTPTRSHAGSTAWSTGPGCP
jgi:hypothetical protein